MNKFGGTPSRGATAKVIHTPNVVTLTKDGNYNFRGRKLCNVKLPTEKSDAVNKEYLDLKTGQFFENCVKLISQEEQHILKKLDENIRVIRDIESKVAKMQDKLNA
jgi:hypothetical protein